MDEEERVRLSARRVGMNFAGGVYEEVGKSMSGTAREGIVIANTGGLKGHDALKVRNVVRRENGGVGSAAQIELWDAIAIVER